jgi:PIN domain nuclease of toxin-antitoxin system
MATRTNLLLLDTHVFLWWRTASSRLGDQAREAIARAEVVYVSAASAWEAVIKVGLGRLELPDRFEAGVEASGFEKLPVTFSHAEEAGALPHHHRDPLDRMLIAQARIERLTLVTHDRDFEPYGVDLLWT